VLVVSGPRREMRFGREVELGCRGHDVAGVIEKRIPHIVLVRWWWLWLWGDLEWGMGVVTRIFRYVEGGLDPGYL